MSDDRVERAAFAFLGMVVIFLVLFCLGMITFITKGIALIPLGIACYVAYCAYKSDGAA